MKPQLGFAIGSTVCPGLSKLIEECGEVCQVAGKLIATGGKPEHWEGSNLLLRLTEELADLHAAMAFVVSTHGLNKDDMINRAEKKIALFWEWHHKQLAEIQEKEN